MNYSMGELQEIIVFYPYIYIYRGFPDVLQILDIATMAPSRKANLTRETPAFDYV